MLHAGMLGQSPPRACQTSTLLPRARQAGTGGVEAPCQPVMSSQRQWQRSVNPSGTPGAYLGCYAVLQKAKLSRTRVFPAVQTPRGTRGLLYCRTHFSLLRDRNHQLRYCKVRGGKGSPQPACIKGCDKDTTVVHT